MSEPIQSIAQNNYILHNIDAKKLYVQEPLFTANSGDAVYVGWRPDETVLWSGTASPSNFPLTMSEPFSAFEKIEFVWNPRYNGDYGTPIYYSNIGTSNYGASIPTKYTLIGEYANASQIWKEYWYLENDNNGTYLSSYKAIYWPGTGGTNSATQTNCRLFKVVGINRKENA